MRIRAWHAVTQQRTIGALSYERARHLPRLVPELALAEGAERLSHLPAALIVTEIERALRRERALAAAGHWRYDMGRHIGLMQALTAERARLAEGDALMAKTQKRRPLGRRSENTK